MTSLEDVGSPPTVRIVVLWRGMSGYLDACLRELQQLPGVQLSVAYRPPTGDSHFDEGQFARYSHALRWGGTDPGAMAVRRLLEAAQPHVIVVCGWHTPSYRRVVREWKDRAVRVLCFDNQWMGAPRQQVAVAFSRRYLHPSYDFALVAGERQAVFARKLGFGDKGVMQGMYSADTSVFGGPRSPEQAFLFAGRLAPEKGIETLAQAYTAYRSSTESPWPLRIAGEGRLADRLRGPGIELLGFKQPPELARLMARSGAFVLPSHFEPWGVVVHEAALSGLPVITTDAVGSAVHLVRDHYNGYIVPHAQPLALASAMQRVASLSTDALEAMGAAGRNLAKQYSPQLWAKIVRSYADA